MSDALKESGQSRSLSACKPYLSESTHWYTKDGKPAYTQIIKTGKNKGEERPTTVRDARKLGLVPSVTTIMGVLDKPALNYWKLTRAVAEAKGEPVAENNAAKVGSAIHGAIEHWIETGHYQSDYGAYAHLCESVFKQLGVTDPVSERSFATDMYAGAVDLHDPTNRILIDFKTKDFNREDVTSGKSFHYDEHGMQLAAYAAGLDATQKDAATLVLKDKVPYTCYNLFLSRSDPSIYVLHQWGRDELSRCGSMFNHLNHYFKVTKGV